MGTVKSLWKACVLAVLGLTACDDYHIYTVTGRVLDPDGGGVAGIQLGCRLNQGFAGSGYLGEWHPISQGCVDTPDAGCPPVVDAGAVGAFTCKVDQLNVNSTQPQLIVVWANVVDAGTVDPRFGGIISSVTVPDQGQAALDLQLPPP